MIIKTLVFFLPAGFAEQSSALLHPKILANLVQRAPSFRPFDRLGVVRVVQVEGRERVINFV